MNETIKSAEKKNLSIVVPKLFEHLERVVADSQVSDAIFVEYGKLLESIVSVPSYACVLTQKQFHAFWGRYSIHWARAVSKSNMRVDFDRSQCAAVLCGLLSHAQWMQSAEERRKVLNFFSHFTDDRDDKFTFSASSVQLSGIVMEQFVANGALDDARELGNLLSPVLCEPNRWRRDVTFSKSESASKKGRPSYPASTLSALFWESICRDLEVPDAFQSRTTLDTMVVFADWAADVLHLQLASHLHAAPPPPPAAEARDPKKPRILANASASNALIYVLEQVALLSENKRSPVWLRVLALAIQRCSVVGSEYKTLQLPEVVETVSSLVCKTRMQAPNARDVLDGALRAFASCFALQVASHDCRLVMQLASTTDQLRRLSLHLVRRLAVAQQPEVCFRLLSLLLATKSVDVAELFPSPSAVANILATSCPSSASLSIFHAALVFLLTYLSVESDIALRNAFHPSAVQAACGHLIRECENERHPEHSMGSDVAFQADAALLFLRWLVPSTPFNPATLSGMLQGPNFPNSSSAAKYFARQIPTISPDLRTLADLHAAALACFGRTSLRPENAQDVQSWLVGLQYHYLSDVQLLDDVVCRLKRQWVDVAFRGASARHAPTLDSIDKQSNPAIFTAAGSTAPLSSTKKASPAVAETLAPLCYWTSVISKSVFSLFQSAHQAPSAGVGVGLETAVSAIDKFFSRWSERVTTTLSGPTPTLEDRIQLLELMEKVLAPPYSLHSLALSSHRQFSDAPDSSSGFSRAEHAWCRFVALLVNASSFGSAVAVALPTLTGVSVYRSHESSGAQSARGLSLPSSAPGSSGSYDDKKPKVVPKSRFLSSSFQQRTSADSSSVVIDLDDDDDFGAFGTSTVEEHAGTNPVDADLDIRAIGPGDRDWLHLLGSRVLLHWSRLSFALAAEAPSLPSDNAVLMETRSRVPVPSALAVTRGCELLQGHSRAFASLSSAPSWVAPGVRIAQAIGLLQTVQHALVLTAEHSRPAEHDSPLTDVLSTAMDCALDVCRQYLSSCQLAALPAIHAALLGLLGELRLTISVAWTLKWKVGSSHAVAVREILVALCPTHQLDVVNYTRTLPSLACAAEPMDLFDGVGNAARPSPPPPPPPRRRQFLGSSPSIGRSTAVIADADTTTDDDDSELTDMDTSTSPLRQPPSARQPPPAPRRQHLAKSALADCPVPALLELAAEVVALHVAHDALTCTRAQVSTLDLALLAFLFSPTARVSLTTAPHVVAFFASSSAPDMSPVEIDIRERAIVAAFLAWLFPRGHSQSSPHSSLGVKLGRSTMRCCDHEHPARLMLVLNAFTQVVQYSLGMRTFGAALVLSILQPSDWHVSDVSQVVCSDTAAAVGNSSFADACALVNLALESTTTLRCRPAWKTELLLAWCVDVGKSLVHFPYPALVQSVKAFHDDWLLDMCLACVDDPDGYEVLSECLTACHAHILPSESDDSTLDAAVRESLSACLERFYPKLMARHLAQESVMVRKLLAQYSERHSLQDLERQHREETMAELFLLVAPNPPPMQQFTLHGQIALEASHLFSAVNSGAPQGELTLMHLQLHIPNLALGCLSIDHGFANQSSDTHGSSSTISTTQLERALEKWTRVDALPPDENFKRLQVIHTHLCVALEQAEGCEQELRRRMQVYVLFLAYSCSQTPHSVGFSLHVLCALARLLRFPALHLAVAQVLSFVCEGILNTPSATDLNPDLRFLPDSAKFHLQPIVSFLMFIVCHAAQSSIGKDGQRVHYVFEPATIAQPLERWLAPTITQNHLGRELIAHQQILAAQLCADIASKLIVPTCKAPNLSRLAVAGNMLLPLAEIGLLPKVEPSGAPSPSPSPSSSLSIYPSKLHRAAKQLCRAVNSLAIQVRPQQLGSLMFVIRRFLLLARSMMTWSLVPSYIVRVVAVQGLHEALSTSKSELAVLMAHPEQFGFIVPVLAQQLRLLTHDEDPMAAVVADATAPRANWGAALSSSIALTRQWAVRCLGELGAMNLDSDTLLPAHLPTTVLLDLRMPPMKVLNFHAAHARPSAAQEGLPRGEQYDMAEVFRSFEAWDGSCIASVIPSTQWLKSIAPAICACEEKAEENTLFRLYVTASLLGHGSAASYRIIVHTLQRIFLTEVGGNLWSVACKSLEAQPVLTRAVVYYLELLVRDQETALPASRRELDMSPLAAPNFWLVQNATPTQSFAGWVCVLASHLANSGAASSELQQFCDICGDQPQFAQVVLPELVVDTIASDGRSTTTQARAKIVAAGINHFFAHCSSQPAPAVRTMLSVVLRLYALESFKLKGPASTSPRLSIYRGGEFAPRLDWLQIARAAQQCGAHLTSLMLLELWQDASNAATEVSAIALLTDAAGQVQGASGTTPRRSTKRTATGSEVPAPGVASPAPSSVTPSLAASDQERDYRSLLLTAAARIADPDNMSSLTDAWDLSSQECMAETEGDWGRALELYDLQLASVGTAPPRHPTTPAILPSLSAAAAAAAVAVAAGGISSLPPSSSVLSLPTLFDALQHRAAGEQMQDSHNPAQTGMLNALRHHGMRPLLETFLRGLEGTAAAHSSEHASAAASASSSSLLQHQLAAAWRNCQWDVSLDAKSSAAVAAAASQSHGSGDKLHVAAYQSALYAAVQVVVTLPKHGVHLSIDRCNGDLAVAVMEGGLSALCATMHEEEVPHSQALLARLQAAVEIREAVQLRQHLQASSRTNCFAHAQSMIGAWRNRLATFQHGVLSSASFDAVEPLLAVRISLLQGLADLAQNDVSPRSPAVASAASLLMNDMGQHLLFVAKWARKVSRLHVAAHALRRIELTAAKASAGAFAELVSFEGQMESAKLAWARGQQTHSFRLLQRSIETLTRRIESLTLLAPATIPNDGSSLEAPPSASRSELLVALARARLQAGEWLAEARAQSPRVILEDYFELGRRICLDPDGVSLRAPSQHQSLSQLSQSQASLSSRPVSPLSGGASALMHQQEATPVCLPTVKHVAKAFWPVAKKALVLLGEFADAQYQKALSDLRSDWHETRERLLVKSREELRQFQQSASGPNRSHLYRIEEQIRQDDEELRSRRQAPFEFLRKALQSYLDCLCAGEDDASDLLVFRVCALWFENSTEGSVNALVHEYASHIPSYKFLPLLHQFAARMSGHDNEWVQAPQDVGENGSARESSPLPASATEGLAHGSISSSARRMPAFQGVLKSIIYRCAIDHPYHTVPIVLALSDPYDNASHKHLISTDEAKTKAAIIMISRVTKALEAGGNRNAEAMRRFSPLEAVGDADHHHHHHQPSAVGRRSSSIDTKATADVVARVQRMCNLYRRLINQPHGLDPNKTHEIPAPFLKLSAQDQLPLLTATLPVHQDGNYDQAEEEEEDGSDGSDRNPGRRRSTNDGSAGVRQDRMQHLTRVVFVSEFGTTVTIAGGLSKPRILTCRGTDGRWYKQIAKGNDDLRQDAVMQQVFVLVNRLLANDPKTRARRLRMRTYRIVPLSQQSGVLEFVEHTRAFGDYLVGSSTGRPSAHERFRPSDLSKQACSEIIKSAAEAALKLRDDRRKAAPGQEKHLDALIARAEQKRLKCFLDILNRFKPVFRHFFFEHFADPASWYARRLSYTRSVAVSCMIGYIVGLGDRHVVNLLVDQKSAEVVHIDFGVAFDQGKILRTPERVPFRLTRDMVDGMGVSGIEGTFRRCSEETMTVMRARETQLLTILEVLLYDPLFNWTISAEKAAQMQQPQQPEPRELVSSGSNSDKDGAMIDSAKEVDLVERNQQAERVLIRCKQKLQGYEDGVPLSVQGQVSLLIQQAISPDNLAFMYHGWQAWV
ncbi:hypothetical protein CAOG_08500 [Capsaspora owczarzaki ATCC 30864]|uniref:non-specific serine/threonine protein kinase n=1 Tax=Capsaspora owczarzaki (strain ATCC 30864) TaxID=595528 RepID=A0A0D2U4B3_CAPO3|nr:hypothetical protein CAOG_08500 [Capsaspora owczarzaki ATCC 30864]KJE90011.1 hypothetical protein CAOG_008500 [Capsaspora owczarzaki ATCC 30864]|eukprot:XP_011270082.1 hypothetical protein CAOG_08500 [Capsaspora owczarzaki ATCC 30864]